MWEAVPTVPQAFAVAGCPTFAAAFAAKVESKILPLQVFAFAVALVLLRRPNLLRDRLSSPPVSRRMAAMPLLNRQPEAPYIRGLLVILGIILAISALRYLPFFLHNVLGVR